ncbi:MAG: hypothetical protein N838_23190 [Thiohalocapsa sp. PB-PSB1]|nr:MAG: hypothetical protein N838_23190 [Thiohalocapsa sp. PB-PSB1]
MTTVSRAIEQEARSSTGVGAIRALAVGAVSVAAQTRIDDLVIGDFVAHKAR